jgi:hypothetical protein
MHLLFTETNSVILYTIKYKELKKSNKNYNHINIIVIENTNLYLTLKYIMKYIIKYYMLLVELFRADLELINIITHKNYQDMYENTINK